MQRFGVLVAYSGKTRVYVDAVNADEAENIVDAIGEDQILQAEGALDDLAYEIVSLATKEIAPTEEEEDVDTNETIKVLRDTLGKLITDWQPDGNSPPNYIRETGLGDRRAIVDVWCGGYQDPRQPDTVGWKVMVESYGNSGVVSIFDGDYGRAIEIAKKKADAALARIMKGAD